MFPNLKYCGPLFLTRVLVWCVLITSAQLALGQPGSLSAAPRIVGAIDETNLVTLAGNTHPAAVSKYDEGAVPDGFSLEHMYVVLRRSPEQNAALNRLLIDLQDPRSALYHRWLSAGQLGGKYGPAQQDIDAVVGWLTSHGLKVNQISKSGITIDVSGTAGEIRSAFHTEIHRYNLHGEQHLANANDPEIPAALAPVVVGLNSLNDFMPKSAAHRPKVNFSFRCTGCPDGFNGVELYLVAPADFATIYNVNPLYKGNNPVTGKGQTIAVLEDTDMLSADVATFRAAFGLSSYRGTFRQIHPGQGCTDPGRNGDEFEAALDSEWAGAVAPDADVELASCADTQTNFGGFIAMQGLLDSNNPPPILSISYGECEPYLGPSGNEYISGLYLQAAVQGISVFVAAGDGEMCYFDGTAMYATGGLQVNGFASTPYNMAVGGTDFLDTAENQNNVYWSKTNNAVKESAKSYVPETTWNESCAGSLLYDYYGFTSGLDFCNSVDGSPFLDIIAGSGGPSIVYAKPYWQTNVYGNPNDGARDLPDVSLFSSAGFWFHDLLLCMSDPAEGGAPCDYNKPKTTFFYNSGGGTSFASPQMASIQALINEKAGARQGNPAPIYYDLARGEYGTPSSPNSSGLTSCKAALGNAASLSCQFYDTTVGNNDLPCYGTNNCYGSTGSTYGVLSVSDSKLEVAYPAHAGWDFATGLGSIDVTNIVNSWP
jgi:subtilase family serine protease